MGDRRILTLREEALLSSKPSCMADVERIELSWDRCADLMSGPVVIDAPVLAMADLHRIAAEQNAAGVIQFVVTDRDGGRWFVVNTEGYDYARYAAQVRGC